MSDTCGYTVVRDGEEEPCDRPCTGWRWYQNVEHEDMLDTACDLHENEGGNRMHADEAELDRLRAEVKRFARRYMDVKAERDDLRARLAKVVALADEWQRLCDRGENGRLGYRAAEYGGDYAADLLTALASVPEPSDSEPAPDADREAGER